MTKILLQKAQVLKARDSIILGAETVTTDSLPIQRQEHSGEGFYIISRTC